MKLLFVAVRGEVKYVGYTHDGFEAFVGLVFGEEEARKWYKYTDPTDKCYSIPAFQAYQVNEELKRGMILVGVDGDSWLFAHKRDIVRTRPPIELDRAHPTKINIVLPPARKRFSDTRKKTKRKKSR